MSQANQTEVNTPENGDKKPLFRLKSVNLQVFVMLAAIAVIMLFFTFTTEGAYLSAGISRIYCDKRRSPAFWRWGWCLSLFRPKLICLLAR
ncbi:sugar transport system permease [Yersinia enterocolitica]|nr:sugar transport system permease [Yersinia enterocolitica]